VLRGGAGLDVGADRCLPAWFRDGLRGATTALEFLRAVAPRADHVKATVEYVNAQGVQTEAKVVGGRGRSSRSSSRSSDASRDDGSDREDGECCSSVRSRSPHHASKKKRTPTLAQQRTLPAKLVAAERVAREETNAAATLYLCEMRLAKTVDNPRSSKRSTKPSAILGARRTKTILRRQLADAFGEDLAMCTLSWDTQDDGVFVGGRNSGKGIHVDQVYWSNVGNNLAGHKLLATWPPGDPSSRLHRDMLDAVFAAPLGTPHLDALSRASRVVLLRPGDVFVISGGVAHATLALDLNVTAYESLVTLNPHNVRHFLRTGTRNGPYGLSRGVMPRSELEDYKDRVVDALEAIADDLFDDLFDDANRRRRGPRHRRRRRSLTPSRRRHRPVRPGFAMPAADTLALDVVLRELFVGAVRLLKAEDRFFRRWLPSRLRRLGDDDDSSASSEDSDDSDSASSRSSSSSRSAARRSSKKRRRSSSSASPNRRAASPPRGRRRPVGGAPDDSEDRLSHRVVTDDSPGRSASPGSLHVDEHRGAARLLR